MINEVFFPGLGLNFTLNRVAITILGRPIYWYALIIITGFLLGWLYCSRKGPKLGISGDDFSDLLLWALPLGIVGARIYYVIFYLDLYTRADGSLDFAAMVRIWDGGLAIYGAVIAGLLVMFFVARKKKIPFLSFADLGVFGLFIGQSVGRWGNFTNVEAYGGVTDLPWRMCAPKIASELFGQGLISADVYQKIIDGVLGVHPTFFYESIWNLVGFLLLVLISRKWYRFDGQLFFGYLTWYGIGRGIIEGMRTDSLYIPHTMLRASQVLGFASALAGILLLMFFSIHRKGPQALWVNRKAAMAAEAPPALDEKEEDEHGGNHH